MIYELILPFQEEKLELLVDSIKVGIDKGSLDALNKGIKLDYAVGDFDSISQADYDYLSQKVKNITKLNPIKDDTDTEHAINMFQDATKIIIHGGIGGNRIEHLLANLNLLMRYPHVLIQDNKSKIQQLPAELEIIKDNYKYVSIFAKAGSHISLSGFKYDLDNYIFKEYDNLCISNEVVATKAKVTFAGSGLIIFSKNDN